LAGSPVTSTVQTGHTAVIRTVTCYGNQPGVNCAAEVFVVDPAGHHVTLLVFNSTELGTQYQSQVFDLHVTILAGWQLGLQCLNGSVDIMVSGYDFTD
jgi:hypothetical protein